VDAAERFEKDYAMGRLAGLSDALQFIGEIVDKLPKGQRELVQDKVWTPLYEESKRRRAEQS